MTVLRRSLGEKRHKQPLYRSWPPSGLDVRVQLRDGAAVAGKSLGWFWNAYTLEVDLHLAIGARVQVWPGRMIRRIEADPQARLA